MLRILGPAIQMERGTLYHTSKKGSLHLDLMKAMLEAGEPPELINYSQLKLGFITSDHQYVDRIAAAKIAVAANQVHPDTYWLVTEDLWSWTPTT